MERVLIIGAVQSTHWILKKLIEHKFVIVGVLAHEPTDPEKVSGWTNFKRISESLSIQYKGFKNINNSDNLDWAKSQMPEIIFAVGFSQLLNKEWFGISPYGCVGFHPTKLPKGRGRAPLAWLVHELIDGAATFFLMNERADDGPIFVQEPFSVNIEDDAGIILKKLEDSVKLALDRWLPNLHQGIWEPIPQNDSIATYYGKRSIEDGLIDWSKTAFEIDRLIKSTSCPHPGAYSYYKGEKIIIWSSEIERDLKIKGIIGRILIKEPNGGLLIQTGDGLLWLKKYDFNSENKISVGDKLGYTVEDEIHNLWLVLKKIMNE